MSSLSAIAGMPCSINWSAMNFASVGIACHVAFDEIGEGCPCEVRKGIIHLGSLGKLLIGDRIGFIGGDEVRVFDAIGSRPAGPADLERVIDFGSALRALPHGWGSQGVESDLIDHTQDRDRSSKGKPDHAGMQSLAVLCRSEISEPEPIPLNDLADRHGDLSC